MTEIKRPAEGAEYYNVCYKKDTDYLGPPGESRFYNLWKCILDNYLDKPCRILDVGCGPGQFGRMCVKRKHKYVGIDFSKVAIRICKKTIPKARCFVVDVSKDHSII